MDAWLDRLKILTAAPKAAEKEKSTALILKRFRINRTAGFYGWNTRTGRTRTVPEPAARAGFSGTKPRLLL